MKILLLLLLVKGCETLNHTPHEQKKNKPPTPIINASLYEFTVPEVSTILKGVATGDSVVTLWTMEEEKKNDCYIEHPDSCSTRVWFRKKGTYKFVFWVANKHGLDSGVTQIVVK